MRVTVLDLCVCVCLLQQLQPHHWAKSWDLNTNEIHTICSSFFNCGFIVTIDYCICIYTWYNWKHAHICQGHRHMWFHLRHVVNHWERLACELSLFYLIYKNCVSCNWRICGYNCREFVVGAVTRVVIIQLLTKECNKCYKIKMSLWAFLCNKM